MHINQTGRSRNWEKKSHPYHNRNPWHTISRCTYSHLFPTTSPPSSSHFVSRRHCIENFGHTCAICRIFLQNLLRLRGSQLINIPLVVDQKGSLHPLLNSLTFYQGDITGKSKAQSESKIQPDSNTMAAIDHILTLSCPDRPGIVYAVTGIFAAHGHNVLDLQQFSDPASERFFMRVHFGPAAPAEGIDQSSTSHLDSAFEKLAAEYTMDYDIRPAARKMRVLLMVSKIGHCLNDILFRMKTGQLQIEVPFFCRDNTSSQSSRFRNKT